LKPSSRSCANRDKADISSTRPLWRAIWPPKAWAPTTPHENIGVSILCPAWVKTGIADAYKNRPSGIDGLDDAAAQHMAVDAVANGIDADVVADWTYDCMMARRLYIFTHPQFHPFVDQRKALIDADAAAAAADPRFAKPTG